MTSMLLVKLTIASVMIPICATAVAGESSPTETSARKQAVIENVRPEVLTGYGLVVGLAGTGDRRRTPFAAQALHDILQDMGVQIPESAVSVDNLAVVLVKASLPPSAEPGGQIDVTLASAASATSLEGGTLLPTSLYGADGQIYVQAQGPVTLVNPLAAEKGEPSQVTHPATARVLKGGLVEREFSAGRIGLSAPAHEGPRQ